MFEVSKFRMPLLRSSISLWMRICFLAVVVLCPALRANAGVMVFTFDFDGASGGRSEPESDLLMPFGIGQNLDPVGGNFFSSSSGSATLGTGPGGNSSSLSGYGNNNGSGLYSGAGNISGGGGVVSTSGTGTGTSTGGGNTDSGGNGGGGNGGGGPDGGGGGGPGVVPEPGSLLIWTVLGLVVGAACWLQRLRGKMQPSI